jgi:hypothetical protein
MFSRSRAAGGRAAAPDVAAALEITTYVGDFGKPAIVTAAAQPLKKAYPPSPLSGGVSG